MCPDGRSLVLAKGQATGYSIFLSSEPSGASARLENRKFSLWKLNTGDSHRLMSLVRGCAADSPASRAPGQPGPRSGHSSKAAVTEVPHPRLRQVHPWERYRGEFLAKSVTRFENILTLSGQEPSHCLGLTTVSQTESICSPQVSFCRRVTRGNRVCHSVTQPPMPEAHVSAVGFLAQAP